MNEDFINGILSASLELSLSELKASDRIGVACSGGVDSMLLVDMLLEHIAARPVPNPLIVLTVDHQLHELSYTNASSVCTYWQEKGVESHHLIADPQLISRGSGPEDGARRARYAVLETSVISLKLAVVFFAHHAGDQAETLLMRLQGPSGLRGMGGIPQRRAWIRRPWLQIENEYIQKIHHRRGLPVYEDPTNQELRYLRNKVRQFILPSCTQTFKPGWQRRMSMSAESITEDRETLDFFINRFVTDLIFDESHIGRMSLRWSINVQEHPQILQKTILRHFYSKALYTLSDHVDRRRVRDQMSLLEEMWDSEHYTQRSLPHGLTIWGGHGLLIITSQSRLPSLPHQIEISHLLISKEEDIHWGEWSLSFHSTSLLLSQPHVNSDKPNQHLGIQGINPSSLKGPLLLTKPPVGARFKPAHSPGSKRVKRLWGNKKVPLFERDRLPILLDTDGNVVWIPYYPPAHHLIESCNPPLSLEETSKSNRPLLYWITWELRKHH